MDLGTFGLEVLECSITKHC